VSPSVVHLVLSPFAHEGRWRNTAARELRRWAAIILRITDAHSTRRKGDVTMDNTTACVLLLAVVVAGGLIVAANEQQKWKRELQQAQLQYQRALGRLKADPANPDLKQKTLELGRHYANLTRQRQGVTIFDEIALMNDINAVTAGGAFSPWRSETPIRQLSVKERLEKLSELKDRGLINEQDYAETRKRILEEI
jgi:hypothetical protein